jgi:aspartyl-tRNA(Asn)/glutamyl-tRNA(Gln) amidotransferase subunit B
MGELSGYLNKEDTEISASPVDAEMLALLLTRIKDSTISGKIAKQVFEALWNGEGKDADTVIESKGLKQITDTGAIEAIVDEIIAANPEQVEQFKAGKEKVLGFFVGQCMKASKGKANPGQLNQLIRDKLK